MRTRIYRQRWITRHDGLMGPAVAIAVSAVWVRGAWLVVDASQGPPNPGVGFLMLFLAMAVPLVLVLWWWAVHVWRRHAVLLELTDDEVVLVLALGRRVTLRRDDVLAVRHRWVHPAFGSRLRTTSRTFFLGVLIDRTGFERDLRRSQPAA